MSISDIDRVFHERGGWLVPFVPEAELKRLRHIAETAVFACLPVLHLQGSDTHGYRLSDRTDTHIIATPEEWAHAAQSIADLHAVLRGKEPTR